MYMLEEKSFALSNLIPRVSRLASPCKMRDPEREVVRCLVLVTQHQLFSSSRWKWLHQRLPYREISTRRQVVRDCSWYKRNTKMVNRGKTQVGIPLTEIFFREDEPCEQSPFDLPRKVEKMEGLFSHGRRGREYAHNFYAAGLKTTY